MRYMKRVTRYITHVTESGQEVLRERSSAVFGNRYVAEVVTAIADETLNADSHVTVRMVASRTGLTDSLVKLVVQRLVAAELLRRLPQGRPRAPLYHEVQRSGGRWDALVELCVRLGHEPAEATQ